jgi:tetratricopeptide (TPR) repeat protein
VLGPVTCAACGAKVREDRVRCLRCGQALVAAQPAQPWRLPVSPTIAGIVVGCLGLGGLAVVFTGGPSADQPAPVAATAVAAAPAAPRPVVTRSDAPVAKPEPVAIALGEKREGIAAYNRGDVSAAVDEFSSALEAHPEDPEALNNLGQALVRAGRAGESIVHFDRAIELSSDVWAYHFNRARAYAVMQQWPRAIAGYRDAAQLFPEDYATQYNLAKALQANGDLPGAIAAFEQAIQRAPGQADFHLSHGLALEAARRPRDAVTAYKRFVELEPESPQAGRVKARIIELEK